MTALKVVWTESSRFKGTLEAPEGYDPALPYDQQQDDVKDALWDALHSRGPTVQYLILDADDDIETVEVQP